MIYEDIIKYITERPKCSTAELSRSIPLLNKKGVLFTRGALVILEEIGMITACRTGATIIYTINKHDTNN